MRTNKETAAGIEGQLQLARRLASKGFYGTLTPLREALATLRLMGNAEGLYFSRRLPPYEPPCMPQNGGVDLQPDGAKIIDWQAFQQFGAPDLETTMKWGPHSCAPACLTMVANAETGQGQTIWQLVQEGIALGAYDQENETWTHAGLVRIAQQHNLRGSILRSVSPAEIALTIIKHNYVLASVKQSNNGYRYTKGHLQLLYGTELTVDGKIRLFRYHDPVKRREEGTDQQINLANFKAISNRKGISIGSDG